MLKKEAWARLHTEGELEVGHEHGMEQWQTNTPSKAGLMKTVKLQANYFLALGF